MTKYSIDQFSSITGITKFVLRTWENRYGYLKAERIIQVGIVEAAADA